MYSTYDTEFTRAEDDQDYYINESTKMQSLGAVVNKKNSDSCACSIAIDYLMLDH